MMESNRLEAFSDGVLAIAITLLVLDLKVPDVGRTGALAGQLGSQWPSYLAYVVSFLVIGIIWINHHSIFGMVRYVDRLTLFVNLVLLLVVSALPYPTRLVAQYITAPGAGRTVALIYSGLALAMGLTFSALFWTVTRNGGAMLHRPMTQADRLRQLRRFGAGSVIYALNLVVAVISPLTSLVIHGALALYYSFDQLGNRVTHDRDRFPQGRPGDLEQPRQPGARHGREEDHQRHRSGRADRPRQQGRPAVPGQE